MVVCLVKSITVIIVHFQLEICVCFNNIYITVFSVCIICFCIDKCMLVML